MRSSVVVSGGMIVLTGVGLFAALDGAAWLALTAGGVVMTVCGFLLEEVTERVEPPLGYQFCLFCSSPVKEGEERCDHCNGLQQTDMRPRSAQALPNH